MAGVVEAEVGAVAVEAVEAELVREVAAAVEGESVGEQAVAVGMVSPRGTMMVPVAAWQSVLVVGRRSPRPAVSIAPTPQPDASRPRPLAGPIRQAE
jgi:hypothetical protein